VPARKAATWPRVVRALSFMMVFILPSCPNRSQVSDSLYVGNTPPVQTHFILEETGSSALKAYVVRYSFAIRSGWRSEGNLAICVLSSVIHVG